MSFSRWRVPSAPFAPLEFWLRVPRSRDASSVRCSSDFCAAAVWRASLAVESAAERASERRSSMVGMRSTSSRLTPRCPQGELSIATIWMRSASPGFRSRDARSTVGIPFHTVPCGPAIRCATVAFPFPRPASHFEVWSSTDASP